MRINLAQTLGIITLVSAIVLVLFHYAAFREQWYTQTYGYGTMFEITVLDDTHSECPPAGNSWIHSTSSYPVLISKTCNKFIAMYSYETSVTLPISHTDAILGSCWGDVNSDGWEDTLVVGSGLDRFFISNSSHHLTQDSFIFNISNNGGSFCYFVDLTGDDALDILRISSSDALSLYMFTDKGYQPIWSYRTGIKEQTRSLVSIFYFNSTQMLSVISGTGLLQLYDASAIPFLNVTDLFNFPRRVLINAVMGDINGDNLQDFVLLYSDTGLEIAFNMGNAFAIVAQQTPASPADTVPTDLAIADFDNNMRNDIIIIWKTTTHLTYSVFLNNGTSFNVYEYSQNFRGNGRAKIRAIGDYNLDGNVDVLLLDLGGAYFLINSITEKNNWIQIELFQANNREQPLKIGIIAGGITQEQLLSPRSLHNRFHFGIGKSTVVNEIYLSGPFDVQHRVYGFLPNQLVTVITPTTDYEHRAFDVLSASGGPRVSCGGNTRRLTPSFFILGVWKTGTTTLTSTIGQHPQILPPSRKEMHYFSELNHKVSISWYWSQFPCSADPTAISFEATASYFSTRPAKAIQTHLPSAKFIVILRDPVERMYSHFHMTARRHANAPQDFNLFAQKLVDKFKACIAQEMATSNSSKNSDFKSSSQSISDGCQAVNGKCTVPYAESCVATLPMARSFDANFYYFDFVHWFKFFPPTQFHIVNYADIVENISAVTSDMQKFLGLKEVPLPTIRKNISPARDPILDSTKELLQNFFEPYNQLLYTLIGENFGWGI